MSKITKTTKQLHKLLVTENTLMRTIEYKLLPSQCGVVDPYCYLVQKHTYTT